MYDVSYWPYMKFNSIQDIRNLDWLNIGNDDYKAINALLIYIESVEEEEQLKAFNCFYERMGLPPGTMKDVNDFIASMY